MKKIYINPEVSFLLLEEEDVIRTSEQYEFNPDVLDDENQEKIEL
jgi:hypothetical protein